MGVLKVAHLLARHKIPLLASESLKEGGQLPPHLKLSRHLVNKLWYIGGLDRYQSLVTIALILVTVYLNNLPSGHSFRPYPLPPNHVWTTEPQTSWIPRTGYLNLILAPLYLSSPWHSLLIALVPWSSFYTGYPSVLVIRLIIGRLFSRWTGFTYTNLFWTGAASEGGGVLISLLLMRLLSQYSIQRRSVQWWLYAAIWCGVSFSDKHCTWWNLSSLNTFLLMRIGKRRDLMIATRCYLLFFLLIILNVLFVRQFLPLTESNLGYQGQITVLLMTAPRPSNPQFLIETLRTYLSILPDPATAASNSSIDQIVVYTHFDDHPIFDLASTSKILYTFMERRKFAKYVSFVRRSPLYGIDRLDQRLHLARGISHALSITEADYLMLSEDDFPLCSNHSWSYMLRLVGKEACAVWIGTGGSGFVIKRSIAQTLPALLLGEDDLDGSRRERTQLSEHDVMTEYPPDLILQDYLLGRMGGSCAEREKESSEDRVGKRLGVVISERLLMRHIGFNSSTMPGRIYRQSDFQCGWRHPLNGDPDIFVY